ncbi:MAG: hypothetical protein GXO62_07315 [Epsilonproteobacteria bacterium]|nr:hypothetical protein [Campylobacterota bacterium]
MKKIALLTGSLLLMTGCVNMQPNTPAKPANPNITVYQTLPNNTAKPITPPITQAIPKQSQKENACIVDNRVLKNCILTLESTGKGVVPCNGTCSTAQAKMMARRSAIVSAYRALAEKMYGIKINGRDTVKNMMLQNSTIRAYVEGLIRGANIVEEDYKEGVYSVVLNLKLDVRKWNAFLRKCKTCAPNYLINYY